MAKRTTVNIGIDGKRYNLRLGVPDGTSQEEIIKTLQQMPRDKLKGLAQRQPKPALMQPGGTMQKQFEKALVEPQYAGEQKPYHQATKDILQDQTIFERGRPYGPIGSARMSFAEEDLPAKMEALERAYGEDNVMLTRFGPSVKNTKTDNWQLIDEPKLGSGNIWEKAYEALNDIIDVTPEAIRQTGQIAGTIYGGSKLGVPGAIGGAGIGRGTGELITESLAGALGVDDLTFGEVAAETGIETAIGAGSEALGYGMRAVGRFLRNVKNKAGSWAAKQYFIMMTGASEEAAEYGVKENFKFLTPEVLNPSEPARISRLMLNAVKQRKKRIGVIFDKIRKTYGKRKVNISNVLNDYRKRLIKDGLAEISPEGKLQFTKGLGVKKLSGSMQQLKQTYDDLLSVINKRNGVATVNELQVFQKQLNAFTDDPNIYQGILMQLDKSIDDTLKATLPSRYTTAKQEWRTVKRIQDLVKKKASGDLSKATQRTNFIDGFLQQDKSIKDALKLLDHYASSNNKFYDNLINRAAATDFARTNVNLLRAGMAGGALSFKLGGPGFGLGVAGTVPKLTGMVYKKTAEATAPISRATSHINNMFIKPTLAPLLAAGTETIKRQAMRKSLEKKEREMLDSFKQQIQSMNPQYINTLTEKLSQ